MGQCLEEGEVTAAEYWRYGEPSRLDALAARLSALAGRVEAALAYSVPCGDQPKSEPLPNRGDPRGPHLLVEILVRGCEPSAARPRAGRSSRTATRVKSIQTWYADIRFRSRLEARWAVFFDALGVDWLYEPQGYEVGWEPEKDDEPPLRRYLPDFYLPDSATWVEVKGAAANFDWQLLADAVDGEYTLPGVRDSIHTTRGLLLLGNLPDLRTGAPLYPLLQHINPEYGLWGENGGCNLASWFDDGLRNVSDDTDCPCAECRLAWVKREYCEAALDGGWSEDDGEWANVAEIETSWRDEMRFESAEREGLGQAEAFVHMRLHGTVVGLGIEVSDRVRAAYREARSARFEHDETPSKRLDQPTARPGASWR
jgi:hypothetical protein